MSMKNALAVCLIALFSASLVVLVAKWVDTRSQSRLEPYLADIAKELKTIRKQGGLATTAAARDFDELIVYYFYRTFRCPTCRAIESQAQEAVEKGFAAELAAETMLWKTVNYEEPVGEKFKEQFEIQIPVVVLAKMKNDRLVSWRRLDEVWGLVNEKQAFIDYVQAEIRTMLAPAKPAVKKPAVEKPEPQLAAEKPKPADASVPAGDKKLPLPK